GCTRSDDSGPAHSCPGWDRNARSRGSDGAGAFHADVERKFETNRIGARSDQAVDMIEAGGFDANERLADLQRPKILDRDREHLRPTGAGGSSNVTAGGNMCIRHGHQCKQLLILCQLAYPDEGLPMRKRRLSPRKTPRQERSRATVEALLEATTDILIRE